MAFSIASSFIEAQARKKSVSAAITPRRSFTPCSTANLMFSISISARLIITSREWVELLSEATCCTRWMASISTPPWNAPAPRAAQPETASSSARRASSTSRSRLRW